MSVYNKIFENLWLRKGYHFIGGFFLLIALVLLGSNFVAFGVVYLVAFWVLARRVSFAMLGILLVLSATHSSFAAMGATIVFWIGDGVAPLVGMRFGQTKWWWNRQKSIAGSLAFFAGSASSLLLFFWLVVQSMNPGLELLALVTALVGTLAEIAPIGLFADRKPDDNFVIIFLSGMTLAAGTQVLGLAIPTG